MSHACSVASGVRCQSGLLLLKFHFQYVWIYLQCSAKRNRRPCAMHQVRVIHLQLQFRFQYVWIYLQCSAKRTFGCKSVFKMSKCASQERNVIYVHCTECHCSTVSQGQGVAPQGGGERRRQPVFQFEEAAKNNVNDEGGGGACSMHWRAAAAAGRQAWQAVMHAYWDRRQLRRRLRSEGRGGGGGGGRKLRNRMRNDRTNERASSGLRASQSANRRRNKFMGSKEGWRCSSSSSRRKERKGKHNCGQKSWVNQYRRQRFLSSAFQLIWRL